MWSSRGHLNKARLNKAEANLNGELIEGTREMAGRRGANPVDECKNGRRRAKPNTVIARQAQIAQKRREVRERERPQAGASAVATMARRSRCSSQSRMRFASPYLLSSPQELSSTM